MWMDRRLGLIVILASALVHVCVLGAVAWRAGRVDAYAFNSLDCGEFYAIAQNIVEHGTFSQETDAPLQPDTWRTPGYPLFLAMFIALLGDSPAMLVVVQQVLSVFNVWLLYHIARGYMSDRRAAVVGGLFLIEPYHLFYSLWLMSTTLFVSILLLIWYTWRVAVNHRTPYDRAQLCDNSVVDTPRGLKPAARLPRGIAHGHTVWYALMGVLAGGLILVRPAGILIPLVVLIGIACNAMRRRRAGGDTNAAQSPWAAVPVFAVCCALVVGVWMTRNRVVAGHFALSHQGGIVLAYFKAAEVELWQQGRTADRYLETSLAPARALQPHTVWDTIDAQLQEKFPDLDARQRSALQWSNLAQGNKTTVNSFDISAALTEVAWSYLTASPVGTAACYLSRCGAVLTFPLNLALKPPTGMQIQRSRSMVRALPYVLLSLWVLVRLAAGKVRFAAAYLPAACVVGLLLATTPQIDPRFRVPMIPFLLFLAFIPKVRTSRGTAESACNRSDTDVTDQAPL